MPKFKKSILPVGSYVVTTPGGTRQVRSFDKSYLETVASNANKMIAAGLHIPAPFKHLKEAVPVTDEHTTDSFQNAGYWDSFEMAVEDGKDVLVGIIDAPGDSANMDTPAGKLQNTIKEVSACIRDNWQDGLGRNWGPCILHAAPVLHPVVPGQDGFSLMDSTVALSLSGLVDEVEQESEVSIGELSQLLKDAVGVFLPTNTSPKQLTSVLKVALQQYKLCRDEDQSDSEIVETQSLFMSLPEGTKMALTKSAAEEMVKLGAINPKTNKAFTLEDFDVVPDKTDSLKEYALALTRQATDDKKLTLRSRIQNLVTNGQTSKEFADANLYPAIETYQLSLGENAQFQKTNIELLVESLESIPAKTPSRSADLSNNGVPSGHHILDIPPEQNADLPEAEAKELLSSMLSMM